MEMLINDNLKDYIKELEQVKSKIKELESIKNDIMFMISKEMGDKEILMNEDGVVTHTYRFSERKSLDNDRLRKERPDIWNDFLKKTNVRTFLTKEKGEMEC
jgi:predicted phage-related endonuclease